MPGSSGLWTIESISYVFAIFVVVYFAVHKTMSRTLVGLPTFLSDLT